MQHQQRPLRSGIFCAKMTQMHLFVLATFAIIGLVVLTAEQIPNRNIPQITVKLPKGEAAIGSRIGYNVAADVLIGVVLPMTRRAKDGNSSVLCELQDDAAQLQVLEALYYTIEIVNNRSDYYPLSIGAIVLDTCSDVPTAVLDTVRLAAPVLGYRYGSYITDVLRVRIMLITCILT
jgi:hypothetical protein